MKKRYVITAATAIAASLTACGVYGPAPDDTMFSPDDGIIVERAETDEPASTPEVEPCAENAAGEAGDMQ